MVESSLPTDCHYPFQFPCFILLNLEIAFNQFGDSRFECNSGDTVILNEDNTENRISFKEGRIVTFNSRIIHRGESPIEGYRISLGFVYPLFDPDNCKHY